MSSIILALDAETQQKAKNFVNKLYPHIKVYKVGLQLFTQAGPQIIQYINKKGAEVFLDLKFFDIPNTIANAVRQAVRLKVKMLTLHISGGEEMLKTAVKAAETEAKRLKTKKPLLIGVTVLTSKKATSQEVFKLAKLGKACGLNGVVCSVKEAARLRKQFGPDFIIITPGIRPNNAKPDDQKRVATVREATKAGSNFLVVGRPILEAKDPLAAINDLLG